MNCKGISTNANIAPVQTEIVRACTTSKIKKMLQSQNPHFECHIEANETLAECIQRQENYYELKGLKEISKESIE